VAGKELGVAEQIVGRKPDHSKGPLGDAV